MSRPRVRRFLVVAFLAVLAGGVTAVTARADSPDVKVTSPAPGQHPFETGTATVDAATGHVTVTLTGGWSWPTHGKDCNTDRAGAGIAVNWFDPRDRGFHVAFFDVAGGAVDNTPGGPDDFGVGSTGAGGLNPVDDVVHPTENDTGTGAVVDITDPANFANWRGGCGVFSSDTVLVNNNGALSYTTTDVAHGNFGRATPTSTDTSGAPFNDPTPPANPALQGALLQHVYASKADVKQVCALTYDVHSGTDANQNNGVGIPGAAKEVTAGQQAVAAGANYSGQYNNDNSIQGNNKTPAGNSCPTFTFPNPPQVDLSITKSASPTEITLGKGNITWTIVVKNNGPDTDTGVKTADPLPAGTTFVSVSTTKGTCTGGSIINCTIGTMAAGETVTITLVTTPTQAGTLVNNVTVVGDVPEVTTNNNSASAAAVVKGFTPPPVFCVAVSSVSPKQLFVGRKVTLTIRLTKHGKAAPGVKVRIKGPKLDVTTGRSNSKGVIKRSILVKKAGIMVFSPLASKRCNTKRLGVTGVFTPPVTG